MDSVSGKRRKLDESDLILSLDDFSYNRISELSSAFYKLCSTQLVNNITILPYKIRSCNATNFNLGGASFSKAFCDLENFDKGFVLGDIFRKGLDIGIDFLDGKIPEAKHEKIVLERLVSFLRADAVIDMEFDTETDTTIALANHLFGKLATSTDYTIDKTCKTKRKGNKCGCNDENCILTGHFGDTSIGNPDVWHGSVDIMIQNDVVVENLEEEPDSPGGKSPGEVMMKSSALSRNSQLVAETIVFSFLQKKRHPERTNFLTPCIGITSSALLIMLYDSEHDVLLESSLVPLMSATCDKKFSVPAILVTWLAVNHQFLCTGLTDEMLLFRADFFEQAKKSLDVYKNNLTIQNVGSPCGKEVIVPSQWSYSAYLLEKQNKIDELNRKRASQYLTSAKDLNEPI